MISPELIRRYPFFAGFSDDQIVTLANVGQEIKIAAGEYLFREGDVLDGFYLVSEGEIAILLEIPDREVQQSVAGQLTGELQTKGVVMSTIGPGEVLAWSALVPPRESTASARATKPTHLLLFDCQKLLAMFEEDCRFGYLMMQKMAQVVRQRLQDMRIESLGQMIG
jgi:CRP-like cAMP-binding protein